MKKKKKYKELSGGQGYGQEANQGVSNVTNTDTTQVLVSVSN